MDYQFRKDLYGQPIAKFSMGHEAIGRWLSDELSNNQLAVQRLIDVISQIEKGHIGFREFNGAEFQLTICITGVEISPLEDGSLEDHILEDNSILQDSNLYEGESFSQCGLSDFKEVLVSWKDFVA